MSQEPDKRRCGFVALVGAPNAGKSTLLNSLVGTKVSIVTPKVQTTRARLRAIAIAGECQIVFVDTPGIFAPQRRLERAMVAAAWSGAEDADLVVLVVDVTSRRRDPDTERIIEGLRRQGRRAVLALNKIDRVKRERLLELAARYEAEGIFDRIFMISALTGDGVGDLLAYLAESLPAGPWLYPEDQLSDLPERLLAAEVTREKLFLKLHQELPYALTVETESWVAVKDGGLRIEQTVYVRRDTQKAIVLGKGGRTIKAVREAAQAELAESLGRPVHLFLFVKVREGWLDDPARYRPWGLDFEA
ncbi:MAG: GTPase Era [Rhodospirillales bacterium]|nr:GTPase Era [Rhodospirillales bacterium]